MIVVVNLIAANFAHHAGGGRNHRDAEANLRK